MKLSELKDWVDSQLENGDNEVFISVDVSTSEEDFDHRIYAEPREKRIAELEKENDDLCDSLETQGLKISELEQENAELKADNDARKFAMAMSEKVEKQLREENAELKDEWQEQVQKATDEGYARTLQTIQLTKAKELLKKLLSSYISYADSFDDRDNELIAEAEQFLSEVEK